MILQNINIIGEFGGQYIKTVDDKIELIGSNEKLTKPDKDELVIEFNDAIAFPGLINSHDHLEFNLFPKLGNHAYKSYREWGEDIHRENKSVIDEINRIPKQLRAVYGIYKNLLNGITTVVHHGEHLNIQYPLIDIFQDCYSLHSVSSEKKLKFKLNNPFLKGWPFVIHVGEGTDTSAFEEINEFTEWNFLKRDLVAVHGVAMNTKQAKKFKALVWCPDSNLFLLNATAKVNELKKETKIIFGTDSTLSASWNIWEQIRLARKLSLLSDKELIDSLMKTPAMVWKLAGKGAFASGNTADIVVSKMKDGTAPMNSFFQTNPEDILLVIKSGEIILFDETLTSQLSGNMALKEFDKVFIKNNGKYLKGEPVRLINKIKSYCPGINIPVGIG